MFYIPEKRLFFVHIPKCAGKSVERGLGPAARYPFAQMEADFGIGHAEAVRMREGEGHDHPVHGRVSPGHLPLWFLKENCPRTWAAFEGALAFAILRDPRDRFISALLQRLMEFRGTGAIRADSPLVRDEAAAVCDWLSGRDRFCRLDYVHFTPQSHYVTLEGRRRVAMLFPMTRLDALRDWLQDKADLPFALGHDHSRRQPRRWMEPLQPVARFAGRRMMPPALRRVIHPFWVRSRLFDDAARQYARVDLGPDVEAFVRDRYAADAALHRAALAEMPPQALAPVRQGTAQRLGAG